MDGLPSGRYSADTLKYPKVSWILVSWIRDPLLAAIVPSPLPQLEATISY